MDVSRNLGFQSITWTWVNQRYKDKPFWTILPLYFSSFIAVSFSWTIFLVFSQLWVNSTSQVLQHCCCYVCLRYITRKLQRLRHSPHYINPRFILKCVPACLALQNVQGKGICFSPCPLPNSLSLLQSWPIGRWQKQEGGGGGGHDKRALSSESRRTQMSKPWICERLCVYPPFLPFPHTTPPSSPSISPSFLPSLFF